MTEAVTVGLDRWLEELDAALEAPGADDPAARLGFVADAVAAGRSKHEGLARNFLAALARAQHDERVRETLAVGFQRTRPRIAALLSLGDDEDAEDAAGLLHSMFTGLLFQALLDPSLAIDGERMRHAQARLREILPSS